MHSITVNVCAYILLLSSVVTIVMLLRKQFRQWKATPLYVLTVSDVLFSILTASILLMNFTQQITNTNYNRLNNTYLWINHTWAVETANKHRIAELDKLIERFATFISENNLNTTLKCDIVSVIIKYGILFLPFINSFVSLLMFSVQCNLNMLEYKNQCGQLLQSLENRYEDQIQTNELNTEMQFESKLELVKSKTVSALECNMNKQLQGIKCCNTKQRKKLTIVFVTSQWVVPAFITGLLSFSNYDNIIVKDLKNTKCFFENIFFLDTCRNNVESLTLLQNINAALDTSPQYEDYINSLEDSMELKASNDTQINKIVSKIQNIVYSAINDTFKPFDTTKHFDLDTRTQIMQENKRVGNTYNLMENASVLQEDFSNGINIRNNNLTMNSLMGIIKGDDAQIYDEILKRIHNTSARHVLQKYNAKEPKTLELRENRLYNSTFNMQNHSSLIEIIIYRNNSTSNVVHAYPKAECLVSVQFLCLYAVALAFFIYFLPIFLVLILHQRGKLNCQIILERLDANDKLQLNRLNLELKNETEAIHCSKSMDFDGPGTSKQDITSPSETTHKSIDLDTLQQLKAQRLDIPFDKRKIQSNIINAIENMLKLFDTIKISLLSCILLWTPLFSEFFIKAFTLLHIPEWLLNGTYFAAIAFSILRNIFNLKMIKLQETNVAVLKTNSIHPMA